MRFGPFFAVAVFALLPAAVKAQSCSATGADAGFTGSADLFTNDDGGGVYSIYSITGTGGYGLGVTGLIPAGGFSNGCGLTNDNLLYPDSSTAVVDANGFAFTDTLGDTDFQVDVFSTGSGNYAAYLLDNDGFSETIPVTLDVSVVESDPEFSITFTGVPAAAATPEPSSLALLATGALGVAGIVRRRMCC